MVFFIVGGKVTRELSQQPRFLQSPKVKIFVQRLYQSFQFAKIRRDTLLLLEIPTLLEEQVFVQCRCKDWEGGREGGRPKLINFFKCVFCIGHGERRGRELLFCIGRS